MKTKEIALCKLPEVRLKIGKATVSGTGLKNWRWKQYTQAEEIKHRRSGWVEKCDGNECHKEFHTDDYYLGIFGRERHAHLLFCDQCAEQKFGVKRGDTAGR